MSVNPYAPPSAAVADPVVPPIPRPRRVNVALLLFGIALTFGIINLTRALIVFPHLPANILIASTMAADVMELVGVVLLFTGSASRWFKQPRAAIH